MFHVEHSALKFFGKMLDFPKILARGRQCESDVRNRCAPCAILRAKATFVKSFLRVWAKFF